MAGSLRLYAGALIFSWLFFFGVCLILILQLHEQKNLNARLAAEVKKEIAFPPPMTSNDDLTIGKTHFTFSPDQRHIAFIQDVYGAYGDDWDQAWALQLFSLEDNTERTLFVDDIHLSGYEWLDPGTIRVFHDGGTGVRAYRDVDIGKKKTLFFKDYKGKESERFWTMDDAYVKGIRESQDAYVTYSQRIESKK